MNSMREQSEMLTNKLREAVEEKGDNLSISDIAKIWNLSINSTLPLMERLMNLGYIEYKNKTIRFY